MKSKVKSKKMSPLDGNSCPHCGTMMKSTQGTLKFPVNGEEISVLNSSHLKCPKCKETILRLDEARKLRESAQDLYRSKYDLLTAGDIQSLRERHGFNQGEFGDLLGLGQNTLSRWEAGRNVQSLAMDHLLRLVRDVPGTLDYLRRLVA